MSNEYKKICAIGIAALSLAACGTSPTGMSSAGSPVTTGTTSTASGYGVVQSVDTISREQASSMGLGTIAGAVVGGVLGNQIGSGRGRTAATVAGAAGGALAGNQMQRNMNTNNQQVYRISVRMDNGSVQTLAQESPPGVQVGDRVRLADGAIVERLR